MNIGTAIKQLRKETVFTQTEFANKIGITQTYLSLIESGKRIPSFEVVQSCSEIIKKPIAVILWRSINEKDVHATKKKIFQSLKPTIDNLINEIFP